MAEPRRLALATFGRSDFSILRPLCELLNQQSDFDIGLWVGGAHFDETSGRTVTEIEQSGIPIWATIDSGPYDRSELGTAELMAEQLRGFAATAAAQRAANASEATRARNPDLLLILGDRFEAVAAGLAMVPLGIPVGHLSGGSITEGAIDDVFRHCLTKIATVHFCDLPRFARRIHLMGEPTDRIFTTGALGLDAFREARSHDFPAFVEKFGLHGLQPGYLLTTLHPESRHPHLTSGLTRATIHALRQTERQVVITHPNADPGSDEIIDQIEAAADGSSVFVVRSFGSAWYPTAMHHAAAMVGNSSGGIIEAASFDLPVVDIGDRQKGREHGPNVIHASHHGADIGAAIATALSPDFQARARSGNIYGDGRGRDRVLAALRSLDWSQLAEPKRFADPDSTYTGELLELP